MCFICMCTCACLHNYTNFKNIAKCYYLTFKFSFIQKINYAKEEKEEVGILSIFSTDVWFFIMEVICFQDIENDSSYTSLYVIL